MHYAMLALIALAADLVFALCIAGFIRHGRGAQPAVVARRRAS